MGRSLAAGGDRQCEGRSGPPWRTGCVGQRRRRGAGDDVDFVKVHRVSRRPIPPSCGATETGPPAGEHDVNSGASPIPPGANRRSSELRRRPVGGRHVTGTTCVSFRCRPRHAAPRPEEPFWSSSFLCVYTITITLAHRHPTCMKGKPGY